MPNDLKMFMTALATILSIVASLGLMAAILAEDWTFTAVSAALAIVLLWIFFLNFLGVRISLEQK